MIEISRRVELLSSCVSNSRINTQAPVIGKDSGQTKFAVFCAVMHWSAEPSVSLMGTSASVFST